MNYQWNPACLTRVFALPAEVVDRHIRLAGSAQLKVLLWLSCRGEGEFDPAACSAAIGLSPADCSDALQYWVACGLLRPAQMTAPQEAAPGPGGQEEPYNRAEEQPAAEPSSRTADRRSADCRSADCRSRSAGAGGQEESYNRSDEQPAAEPSSRIADRRSAGPGPRPRAVKPSLQEVLQRQKENPDFAYLLDTTSARLGRPISHGDMETLLYLYETAGLPIEVILMVVGYAVSAGKLNMRYVEKVALDWADRGIDTMAAAEEYLCALERRDAAAKRVQSLLGLERSFTVGQMEQVEKWVCLWKLPDSLIALAARVCREKIGKFQCTYVDRILEGWHQEGIDSAEKAEALISRSKAKAKGAAPVENSSLDLDEYEQRVADYVPVYKKRNA